MYLFQSVSKKPLHLQCCSNHDTTRRQGHMFSSQVVTLKEVGLNS